MAATQNILSQRPDSPPLVPVTRRLKTWNKSIFDILVLNVGTGRMQKTLEMFSESLPEKERVIAEEHVDVRQVRYQVHDLASTSGFLGFERLFERCLELLEGAKSIPRARKAILTEIQMARQELKAYIARVSMSENYLAQIPDF